MHRSIGALELWSFLFSRPFLGRCLQLPLSMSLDGRTAVTLYAFYSKKATTPVFGCVAHNKSDHSLIVSSRFDAVSYIMLLPFRHAPALNALPFESSVSLLQDLPLQASFELLPGDLHPLLRTSRTLLPCP